MNTLFVAVFASLAVYASAGLIGAHHGSGAIVSGPSGIVTSHGAIGPQALGLGYGLGHGLGYGGVGAVVAAPAVATSYVAGPVALGHSGYGGLGYAGYGGYGHGGVITNGGGVIGLSGHGVAVRGPATVPAVISGPAGKIVAHGLYGVPSHYGHGHSYGW